MKVRQDRDLGAPINMRPGDRFQLVYTLRGHETVLLEEDISKDMQINYLAVLELDNEELQQFGLTQALVGLFGYKEKGQTCP